MSGNSGINGLLAIQQGFFNQLLGEKKPTAPDLNKEIEDRINEFNQEMQKAISHTEIALDMWEETIEDLEVRGLVREKAAKIRRDFESIINLCRPRIRPHIEKNIRSIMFQDKQLEEYLGIKDQFAANNNNHY